MKNLFNTGYKYLNCPFTYYCFLLISLFLGFVTQAVESAEINPTFHFKGFGTIGLSGSDSKNLGFRRDYSQGQGITNNAGFDLDSRLGLQFDLYFNPNWQIGVQWVARNHVGNFIEQNLDWAFLKWSPNIDTDIRLGRLGVDVFLLSDYRNVGYAYPWIRPPHEYYASLPVYHFDGADISQRFNLGEGIFTVKVLGGYIAYDVSGTIEGMTTSEFNAGLLGLNLLYELDDWRFKMAYTWDRGLNNPESINNLSQVVSDSTILALWPEAQSIVNNLKFEGSTLQFGSIGVGFDDGLWLVQFESSYIDSDYSAFPSVASGYLSVGRRFDKLTLFGLYGIAQSLKKHVELSRPLVSIPQIEMLRDGIQKGLNTEIDQMSLSLGFRYDVYKNIALKAQWSHFWLGNNGKSFWLEPQSGDTPETVNVWSFGIDFIF